MTELAAEHCRPLSGPEHRLSTESVDQLLAQLPGWGLDEQGRLHRRYAFPDFVAALKYTNSLGEIAESEGHHPDLELGWGYVVIHLSTHDVGGLSRNDFVLAARAQALAA